MASTLRISHFAELDGVNLLDGHDRVSNISVTGQVFRVYKKSIGTNTRDTLWTKGEGGLDTFSHALILADGALWVEWRTDRSTDQLAVMGLTAGVPQWLGSDDLGCNDAAAAALDGSDLVEDTDYSQVDQVVVQNDDNSTAVIVSLWLIS